MPSKFIVCFSLELPLSYFIIRTTFFTVIPGAAYFAHCNVRVFCLCVHGLSVIGPYWPCICWGLFWFSLHLRFWYADVASVSCLTAFGEDEQHGTPERFWFRHGLGIYGLFRSIDGNWMWCTSLRFPFDITLTISDVQSHRASLDLHGNVDGKPIGNLVVPAFLVLFHKCISLHYG